MCLINNLSFFTLCLNNYFKRDKMKEMVIGLFLVFCVVVFIASYEYYDAPGCLFQCDLTSSINLLLCGYDY